MCEGGGGGSSNGGGHLPHMFHTLNEKLFVSHSLSWSYHNHPPCFLLYILYFIIIWLLPRDIQNMLSLGFFFFGEISLGSWLFELIVILGGI